MKEKSKRGQLLLLWLKRNNGEGFLCDYKNEMSDKVVHNYIGAQTFDEEERAVLSCSEAGYYEWDFSDRLMRVVKFLERKELVTLSKVDRKNYLHLLTPE